MRWMRTFQAPGGGGRLISSPGLRIIAGTRGSCRVAGIAGTRAYAGFPVLSQEWLEIHNLLFKAMRGIADKRQFVPDEAGRGIHRFDMQPRCVRVSEVGEYQHRRRMFEEAVGHFLQCQPYVLEADLLADHIKRHMGEAVVHGAHHPREHGSVADARIEHAYRRRTRMNVSELFRNAVRDLPFLTAGIDEEQILLPIIEKAEVALRVVGRFTSFSRSNGRRCRGQGSRWAVFARSFNHDGTGPLRWVGGHKAVDAVKRVGGNAAPVAQPRGKFAVVDCAPAESRLGQPGLPAIIRYFLK